MRFLLKRYETTFPFRTMSWGARPTYSQGTSQIELQGVLKSERHFKRGVFLKRDNIDCTKMGPLCKIDFDKREFGLNGQFL